MPAPILATKLFIPPPRPKIVIRSRLIERLNEGFAAGRKLTLISAPAGFGKTTLISEWVAGCEHPTAWLSLEEADSTPTRFLAYLIAALQTLALPKGHRDDVSKVEGISSNIGEGVLAMLQSPQPPPTETLLTTLLNEIAAIQDNPSTGSGQRFILVLDDYHVIEAQPVDASTPVDDAITFLVEHLPPQMHLVIASREDPPLPLARLRARGQLIELRAADLRFSPAEAAEFLNQVMDLKLSAKDIAALDKRTEGWIAGLQLAALSMQGHRDTTDFIKSFTGSHHFVLDYLLEEVLHQQPESIQTFLLRTSILDRLCGPLCDAVLHTPSVSGQETIGQETLEYLERANLFIVPLDNERRWYRYHHLFGDLLRQRLMQSLKSDQIAQCHLRASQWFEENGDLAEAFQHAIAAWDFNRAAGLAEAAWQGMDESFQTAAWLGWVKKLPEEAIRVRPVLSTQIGYAFMDAGEPETSESHLRDAERCLNGSAVTDEAQLKPLPAMIAMARAYNAQVQGDLAAAVKYAELALQLIPEDDFFRRAQATITLEITHWASGDLEAARLAMDNWMNSMQKAGNLVFVVASAFAVADILVAQGRLREAERTYRQYLALAAAQGPEAEQITAHHHLGLALLYHEMDDQAAAAQHLQKARELGEQTTLVDWSYRWRIAQARLKESEGELDTALELLDEAKRVYVKNPIPDLRPVEALKVRVYLKQKRFDKAQACAGERGLAVADEISYLREYEHLTLARMQIAERSFAGVNELLERLLAAAEGQKRLGSGLEILVTQTLAYQAQGNLSLALASLERALTLAEPEGYLRIFVDEGEVMRLLILDFRFAIEKQARSEVHPLLGYVDKLLVAFPQLREANQKSKIQNPKLEMFEPLSERELETLHLIAQGLSNGEISRRLFLALSTVKGYNQKIFDKLQVQNRTEAVIRARELGLL
jgi:LuxR family transcriptional regulator, maltose regulon positive regulatory protein